MKQVPVRDWQFLRAPEYLEAHVTVSRGISDKLSDSALAKRIAAAYTKASETEVGQNFWTDEFAKIKWDIHEVLVGSRIEALTRMLFAPHTNDLLYGFENLSARLPSDDSALQNLATKTLDALIAFAEAIAAVRTDNPEDYSDPNYNPRRRADETIKAIEARLDIRLEFPNIYEWEPGLETKRGVASYRAVLSAYQGMRTAQIVQNRPVLEIGGGLGRAAYYASMFGIEDYTIIDIPMMGVAQAYFSGKTLGPDAISLYGEQQKSKIKLLPPSELFAANRQYALVVNVDSFPEIADDMGAQYMGHLSKHADLLLSINHETRSPRTVRQIAFAAGGKSIFRQPFWLRRGYVEELFSFEK
jgi:hypothetical protein